MIFHQVRRAKDTVDEDLLVSYDQKTNTSWTSFPDNKSTAHAAKIGYISAPASNRIALSWGSHIFPERSLSSLCKLTTALSSRRLAILKVSLGEAPQVIPMACVPRNAEAAATN